MPMLDDPKKTAQLMTELKAAVPFKVELTPWLINHLHAQHDEIAKTTEHVTRRQGEPLHPDREPLDTLDRIRRTIGEYNFAGQYQQSPPRWAAGWSRPNGSSAIARTSARSASTVSCRA